MYLINNSPQIVYSSYSLTYVPQIIELAPGALISNLGENRGRLPKLWPDMIIFLIHEHTILIQEHKLFRDINSLS